MADSFTFNEHFSYSSIVFISVVVANKRVIKNGRHQAFTISIAVKKDIFISGIVLISGMKVNSGGPGYMVGSHPVKATLIRLQ